MLHLYSIFSLIMIDLIHGIGGMYKFSDYTDTFTLGSQESEEKVPDLSLSLAPPWDKQYQFSTEVKCVDNDKENNINDPKSSLATHMSRDQARGSLSSFQTYVSIERFGIDSPNTREICSERSENTEQPEKAKNHSHLVRI